MVNISTSQTLDARGAEPAPRSPDRFALRRIFRRVLQGPARRARQLRRDRPRRVNSLGSGFIIDPAGIVVTNNHVIADADEVTVILNDGTKLKAEVVGRDKKTDLAVLQGQVRQAAAPPSSSATAKSCGSASG